MNRKCRPRNNTTVQLSTHAQTLIAQTPLPQKFSQKLHVRNNRDQHTEDGYSSLYSYTEYSTNAYIAWRNVLYRPT